MTDTTPQDTGATAEPETAQDVSVVPEIAADKVPVDAAAAAIAERKKLRGTAYLLFQNRPPIGVSTVDISVTGICIVAPISPPLKIKCSIRFYVPLKAGGSQMLTTQATVIYSVFNSQENGFKVGFQLVLTPEIIRVIAQYVEK